MNEIWGICEKIWALLRVWFSSFSTSSALINFLFLATVWGWPHSSGLHAERQSCFWCREPEWFRQDHLLRHRAYQVLLWPDLFILAILSAVTSESFYSKPGKRVLSCFLWCIVSVWLSFLCVGSRAVHIVSKNRIKEKAASTFIHTTELLNLSFWFIRRCWFNFL